MMNNDTTSAERATDLPPLPRPARRQGEQMSNDGNDKVFFDCFDPTQMLAYGRACIEAALRSAVPAAPAPQSAQIAPEGRVVSRGFYRGRERFACYFDAGTKAKVGDPVYLAQPVGAQVAAPVAPELVAWIRRHPDGRYSDDILPNWQIESVRKTSGAWAPLYAGAPPVQELSDEQIVDIRDQLLPSQGDSFDCIAFARAVLAAATSPQKD